MRNGHQNDIKDFFARETRTPIYAFWNTMRWILKQMALFVLRVILWGFFFMLPSFSVVLFVFHWFTAKMQEEIPKQNRRPAAFVSQERARPQRSMFDLSMFHTLSQDFRYWRNEILRFKK